MDRRRRSLLLGLAAIGAAPPCLAQPAKLPRIALLDSTDRVETMGEKHLYWGPLLVELRRLGHVEGNTLAVERWSGSADTAGYAAMVKKLAATRPDVIVAWGFTMISAIAAATKSVPIVGVGTISRDVRESFARPASNVTGVHTTFDQELYVKLAEFLRQVTKPGARIAWLGPQHQWDGTLGHSVREGARRAGLDLQPAIVGSPVNEAAVRAAFAAKGPSFDGLYVSAAIELRPHRYLIAELALAARLPSIGAFTDDADAGLLMSYSADVPAAFHRAAYYVDRILKGVKPSDLPIELPTKIALTINRRTAKALAITLPQELVFRADRVID